MGSLHVFLCFTLHLPASALLLVTYSFIIVYGVDWYEKLSIVLALSGCTLVERSLRVCYYHYALKLLLREDCISRWHTHKSACTLHGIKFAFKTSTGACET